MLTHKARERWEFVLIALKRVSLISWRLYTYDTGDVWAAIPIRHSVPERLYVRLLLKSSQQMMAMPKIMMVSLK